MKFAAITYTAVIIRIETGADIVIGAIEFEVTRAPAVWLIRDVVTFHLPSNKVELNDKLSALNVCEISLL